MLASEGKSCRPENNNYSKSIRMSWPLSVKHAAKITFAQYKCRTFQSIIYPADKNNLIGISSILAWGKSRVGQPPPFIAAVSNTSAFVWVDVSLNLSMKRLYSKKLTNPIRWNIHLIFLRRLVTIQCSDVPGMCFVFRSSGFPVFLLFLEGTSSADNTK